MTGGVCQRVWRGGKRQVLPGFCFFFQGFSHRGLLRRSKAASARFPMRNAVPAPVASAQKIPNPKKTQATARAFSCAEPIANRGRLSGICQEKKAPAEFLYFASTRRRTGATIRSWLLIRETFFIREDFVPH